MISYRQLDTNLDYVFGQRTRFLVDTPEAVAQAINTRLLLWAGEWFLDLSEGTPYLQEILGYGTQDSRDIAIKERVLGTPGVLSIVQYSSSVQNRKLRVECTVRTQFGDTTFTSILG